MAKRFLNINGKGIYLKGERDYNKRLEITIGILNEYPEAFDMSVEDQNIFAKNSARLDFLTFYLLYDAYDEDILSYKQLENINRKEIITEF